MSHPMPLDELTVDFSEWTPERAYEIAQSVVDALGADAKENPRGDEFHPTLSLEQVAFISKAMVVQLQLTKMSQERGR